jgi:hypothetical protein
MDHGTGIGIGGGATGDSDNWIGETPIRKFQVKKIAHHY